MKCKICNFKTAIVLVRVQVQQFLMYYKIYSKYGMKKVIAAAYL